MKLVFVSKFGQTMVRRCNHIPRMGERVDMFYSPIPGVAEVINFPSDETLEKLGGTLDSIDAVIILD